MRTIVAGMMAAALLAASARAQAPAATPSPAASDPILSAGSAEVAALIARARAEIRPGAPNISLPLLRLMPYRANLEYRVAATPPTAHLHDAEFVFVVAGSGSLMVGGTLADAKTANGNVVGTALAGGTQHRLTPGGAVLVPEGVPHWFNAIEGSLAVIALHVPHPVDWPR